MHNLDISRFTSRDPPEPHPNHPQPVTPVLLQRFDHLSAFKCCRQKQDTDKCEVKRATSLSSWHAGTANHFSVLARCYDALLLSACPVVQVTMQLTIQHSLEQSLCWKCPRLRRVVGRHERILSRKASTQDEPSSVGSMIGKHPCST